MRERPFDQADMDQNTELALRADFGRSNVKLTHEECARMFYWCRDQAYDNLGMARQMRMAPGQLKELKKKYFDEAMMYLFVARSVFPMTENGETVSIEDILNGKEPKVFAHDAEEAT